MIAVSVGYATGSPLGLAAFDVEEISLPLPRWQVAALAQAAQAEGLTVGQYVRRLLSQTLKPTSPTERV